MTGEGGVKARKCEVYCRVKIPVTGNLQVPPGSSQFCSVFAGHIQPADFDAGRSCGELWHQF